MKKKINKALCYDCYLKHYSNNGKKYPDFKVLIDGEEIVIYHSSPSTARICWNCGKKAAGRNLILYCKPEDTWWNRKANL